MNLFDYRILTFIILSLGISNSIIGQENSNKRPIDITDYFHWEESYVGDAKLSNDGKFLTYDYSLPGKGHAFVIKSINNQFYRELRGAVTFSEDSRWAICRLPGDSLGILNLIDKTTYYIRTVQKFKTISVGGRQLIVLISDNNLVIKNLNNNKESRFANTKDFLINDHGTAVVYTSSDGHLKWVDTRTLDNIEVFQGETSNLTFDDSGNRLAFTISKKSRGANMTEAYQILCYDRKSDILITLVDDDVSGFKNEFSISPYPQLLFNQSGDKLFFKLEKRIEERPKDDPTIVSLNIWNYKDDYLQSDQLKSQRPEIKSEYSAVVNLNDAKVVLLDKNENDILPDQAFKNAYSFHEQARYVLVGTSTAVEGLFFKPAVSSLNLMSTATGEKEVIFDKRSGAMPYCTITDDEKYVIWFDYHDKLLNSYEIATGITRTNICDSIRFSSIVGSIRNESTLIVYDDYDIWRVDLTGKNRPVNVTNGFGVKHGIVLKIAEPEKGLTGNVLLAAFDKHTKNDGFFWKNLREIGDPLMCSMAPFNNCLNLGLYVYLPNQFKIVSDRNGTVYIIKRMSASDAPNLYLTHDFKKFQKLTDIQPHKKFNWLTSELVTWKMTDGKMSQGILYKPENFDSNKKYPLIFQYYEERSDELNIYRKPELAAAIINIPQYVSNGYIVFIPDIHFKAGEPVGNGAVNSVISAAKYLSQNSWIDTSRMGLDGHSFGGFETFYLITHSNLFAAACGTAGVADKISSYGQLMGNGGVRQAAYEVSSQGNPTGYGGPPWINPEIYIDDSPLFSIDKVTTPLLMMHNKNDGAVPFEQGIEMFTGMRRAGKKVWMLEYTQGNIGHYLVDADVQLDYTIRQMQFFDHYLKGSPPPIWMTRGRPSRLKKYESALGLDSVRAKP